MEERQIKHLEKSRGILAWLLIVAVVALIGVWTALGETKRQKSDLEYQNFNLSEELGQTKNALDGARDSVDKANAEINQAQGSAGDSYDAMNNALNDLETVTVY